MGIVLRSLIQPRSIAFASRDRLAAVDGDGKPSLGGRFSALIDAVPLLSSASSVRAYHSYDLLVTSHNPLLAALALRLAARADRSIAIVACPSNDPWPYDLAATDEIGHLIAAALSIDVLSSEKGALVTDIVERILADVPRKYPVILNAVSLGSRHPIDEGVFFFGDLCPRVENVAPFQKPLSDVFDRFMVRRPRLSVTSKGRTVLFARRMLLTGRPDSFGESRMDAGGQLRWGRPVTAVGSARWDLPTYPDAAKAMLEDILMLCRELPV